MFESLKNISARPKPFEFYTARDLWTDSHIAGEMLRYHLDDGTELASRNGRFIDRSVRWMIEHFGIRRETRICDLGCGPGLYATRLANHGASVTGVDFSENSIRYARKAAQDASLDIDYVQADYLANIPAGPFDVVTLIYCDFGAMSPGQHRVLLERVADSLSADGILLLDVCSLQLFDAFEESSRVEKFPEGGFWSPDPHYVLVNIFKYPKEKLLLHKYTIIEQSRTRDIYNWIQCYDPDSIRREFESNGFEVAELFGNVAGEPWQAESKEIAVVARRKA